MASGALLRALAGGADGFLGPSAGGTFSVSATGRAFAASPVLFGAITRWAASGTFATGAIHIAEGAVVIGATAKAAAGPTAIYLVSVAGGTDDMPIRNPGIVSYVGVAGFRFCCIAGGGTRSVLSTAGTALSVIAFVAD